MGYTHFWNRKEKGHKQETWDKFVKDCKKLYKNMPEHSLSAGGYFKDDPLLLEEVEFTKDVVCFNDQGDLGHETFSLTRKYNKEDWLFCKTSRKPYDLMVTACLVLYKTYFPKEVEISSGGSIEDWHEAFKFITLTLPKGSEVSFKMLFNESLFEKNLSK